MVQFNFFRREVNCKIVYYGPGLSGKTTNLEIVHHKTPGSNRGELTSIATEQDRTLFFDFMPIDLGTVAGMKTKLRLFTVPGQVFYNSTRKLVLQGSDGVIFVADSQASQIQDNLDSLKNLEENLAEHGMNIRELPLIIQWNKRDMPTALPVEELESKINYLNVPTFEGVAVTGVGVFPTLKKCAALVLESVAKKANEANRPGSGVGRLGASRGPSLQPSRVGNAPPRIMTPPNRPPSPNRMQPGGHSGVTTPQHPTRVPPSPRPIIRPQNPNVPGGKPMGAPPSSPAFTPSSQATPAPRPVFKKFKKFLDKGPGQEDQ